MGGKRFSPEQIIVKLPEAESMIERWVFITMPKGHLRAWGIDPQHQKRYSFQAQL